jgi:hypothetical protein
MRTQKYVQKKRDLRPTMAEVALRRLVAGQRQRSASGYLPRQERSGGKREQKKENSDLDARV